MLMRRFTVSGLFLAMLAFGLMGCGSDAPETHHVSGSVTFDGKPIPAGQIYFMPDGSKGNSGPAGFAQIKDGKYDTSLEGGKGHASGPMIVKIEGQDPAATSDPTLGENSGETIVKTLFPTYQTTADLPKDESTQDFAVPAEAADRVIKSETSATPGGV